MKRKFFATAVTFLLSLASLEAADKKEADPVALAKGETLERTADPLAVPPAQKPISTEAQQAAYSEKSTLGRAMREHFEELEAQSVQSTKVVEETMVARVTAYDDGDANSAAGRSSTHVPLQEATQTEIGVAAGPVELLGSYVIVEREGKKYRYLIADTGSAVEKKTASDGKAPVIDLYHEDGQEWPDYQKVVVVKITGASHMMLRRPSERDEFLDPEVFRRARELARRG